MNATEDKYFVLDAGHQPVARCTKYLKIFYEADVTLSSDKLAIVIQNVLTQDFSLASS